ncbi:uncharacterized protein BDW43DRAFT_291036 [Aspergillus alliaceus]|uniref:uncharacterized protein n=1 Tax=Petromyces alliaceus TaxID=209559 RepID=UPI0012A465D4|nr:uncharacterized protein BDW43DRAFT_291036 [Aspergillus alliaceus]KAB8228454.1 hypothetical protein BDW43DRAFT_291036 [Aspergillus alliaceus]
MNVRGGTVAFATGALVSWLTAGQSKKRTGSNPCFVKAGLCHFILVEPRRDWPCLIFSFHLVYFSFLLSNICSSGYNYQAE